MGKGWFGLGFLAWVIVVIVVALVLIVLAVS